MNPLFNLSGVLHVRQVFFILSLLFSANMAYAQIDSVFESYLQTIDIEEDVPRILPNEIVEHAEKEPWLFLDTRPEEEFIVSHIPGARRIGFMPREAHVLEGLDKDQPIVVYCTVGWRSSKVGAWLMSLGFTRVYNLYGGIIVWANADKELQKPSGENTDRVHVYGEDFKQWLKQGEATW